MKPANILLLTNRDSDNVGDQIIEATVISIIKGVMKNLGFAADDFTISSRAAGIISKKYVRTRDPQLLAPARNAIANADLIIFGGAPLFNYRYQNFYQRTITTLELAQEYEVPVLFSSIGVEKFDAENEKSRALKRALELPVVKQMTTRDDLDSLRKYAEGTEIPVAQVADPAVLADIVYRKKVETAGSREPLLSFQQRAKRKLKQVIRRVRQKATAPQAPQGDARSAIGTSSELSDRANPTGQSRERSRKKRIGLVVTRAGIFADNGIDFGKKDQRRFWLETIDELIDKGYDYRLFTTGHFTDEAFLDGLVRSGDVPGEKAAVNVNSPDELLGELRGCDGVIAYRLHASITSFALNIPSIGLSWNFKVPYFYESVGYGNRALDHTRWNAQEVVAAIEMAMAEGVSKDTDFLKSVYDTLFSGIRSVVSPESSAVPVSFSELWKQLPRQAATSPQAYREKVNRKLRRAYENYQKLTSKPRSGK